MIAYFLSSRCLIRKVYSKGLAEQLLKLRILENGGLSICLKFIVSQTIGAIVEKENLFNFLVCEVFELGMVIQLVFMAQMMLEVKCGFLLFDAVDVLHLY